MNMQRTMPLAEQEDPAVHDALGRLVRRLAPLVLRDAAERLRKPLVGLTADAERLLASAVAETCARELRQVLERACVMAEGEFITGREVEGAMLTAPALAVAAPLYGSGPLAPAAGAGDTDTDLLTTVEREHIQRALQRAGGNKKLAAQILGLSRRALYRRLERLQLGDTITRRPRFEARMIEPDRTPSNPLEPSRT